MSIKALFSTVHLDKKIICGIGAPSLCSMGALAKNVEENEYKIMVNYNGQADLLLSLQIPPDYYPYQFKKFNLYDYLTNVDKYLVSNDKVSEGKKKIKAELQKKINELLGKIKEFGPSLWNEDLYDTGIVFRNKQFWNSKKTTLLFLEQFIADDYQDIRESYDLLPRHKKLIVTNYRAARDPYTIFSRKIFDCFMGKECTDPEKKIYEKFKTYVEDYDREESDSLYRFGRFIKFWNELISKNEESLMLLGFWELIKDENQNLFSVDPDVDKALAEKYKQVVFTDRERCLLDKWKKGEEGKNCTDDNSSTDSTKSSDKWEIEYLSKNSKPSPTHHPALEQQLTPGTAPLAEGSQKDIMVFLYQFAASINSYTKSQEFNSHFSQDYRKDAMKNALNNAYQMAKDLNDRIANIREYFKKIDVVDKSFDPTKKSYTTTNSKTFTVLTYPPSAFGAGEATIQSMSKFPWLYRDIGLRQPMHADESKAKAAATKVSETHNHDEEQCEDGGEVCKWSFSVDDNGWWWKIGSANLTPKHLLKFKNTTDTLLVLANEDDWNLLQDKTSRTLSAATVLLKNAESIKEIDVNKVQGNEPKLKSNSNYPVSYNKYHLWNEGLRSPIALNLLLDNLVDIFQRQYDSGFSKATTEYQKATTEYQKATTEYQKAMNWGTYWSVHFLQGKNVQTAPEQMYKTIINIL